jgi:hypothetical protein
MSDSATYWLRTPQARQNAREAILVAPEGYVCQVKEPTRNLDQNAALHAALADIVKAKVKWAGREWDIDSWRAIFVSAHAKAENLPVQTIPGLEGEFVAIRRSTTRMTKSELSGLIDYVFAKGTEWGVVFRDRGHSG